MSSFEARRIIRSCLNDGSLRFGNFRGTAGGYIPMYFDSEIHMRYTYNQLPLGYALARTLPRLDYDIVLGIQQKGILPGNALADALETEYVTIDKSGKIRGMHKDETLKGKKCVIVDNAMNTGGSMIKGLNVVRFSDPSVADVCVILDYGLPREIEVYSLFDLDLLLQTAQYHDSIDVGKREEILKWRDESFEV